MGGMSKWVIAEVGRQKIGDGRQKVSRDALLIVTGERVLTHEDFTQLTIVSKAGLAILRWTCLAQFHFRDHKCNRYWLRRNEGSARDACRCFGSGQSNYREGHCGRNRREDR